jgi:hypothetical protein
LVKFEVVQKTKCINQSVLKEKKEEQTLNVSKIKDKIYVTDQSTPQQNIFFDKNKPNISISYSFN